MDYKFNKGEITQGHMDKSFTELMAKDLKFDVSTKKGFSKMGIGLMVGIKWVVGRKGA